MAWQRLSGFTLLTLLALTAAAGRADDDLAQFVQRSKLAAQRLATDVNHALAQAKALEKSEPAQAQALLERARDQVRDARDLPETERVRLTQLLQARLRQVGEVVRQRRVADAEAPRLPEPARRAPAPPPAGASDFAQGFIAAGKAQLDASRANRVVRDNGFNGVIRGVETSALPMEGSIAFAKNWKELSERRKQTVGPHLSPKEIALLKTLNSTLSVDFRDNALREVLNYLQEKTGLAIIVDLGSLKDAMIDYEEEKVTFKANKVTVRTILRKLLADRGLAYILKEGTVQVVTAQKARETMVVRTYPINDLVSPGPYAQMFGPFVARMQSIANAQGVINMIQHSIDPAMWNVNGGPASITYFPPSMSLVIRASAEMHYSLGGTMFGP
jgi:hypothetical protein